MKTPLLFKYSKSDKSEGYLSFVCALLVAAIMPLYHWYLPPVIILWFLVRTYELLPRFSGLKESPGQVRLLFTLFMLMFTWQLIGLAYTKNFPAGLRNIELRLSLFLFPLLLISPGKTITNRLQLILNTFALSNFIFIVLCLVLATVHSSGFSQGSFAFNPHPADAPWLNYFFAMKLSIYQHPSYLAMFSLFSAFIAADNFFSEERNLKLRISWLIIGFLLLISVFLLSSRAGILAAIVTIPFYFFRLIKRGEGRRQVLIGLVVFIIMAVPLSLTNPRVRNHLKSFSSERTADSAYQNGRILIWGAVASLAKENFIFGVGTGDIQDEINKKYIEIGRSDLAKDNFNTHNQFIEILIENGIIGLAFFILIIVAMLHISIREWNLLYVLFILVIFLSFMFETMLNRLAGVAFFTFFSFLLAIKKGGKDKISA